jgi:hypothetical protein
VTGGWTKVHNGIVGKNDITELFSSPSMIRMTTSRRMRWAGHVTRVG